MKESEPAVECADRFVTGPARRCRGYDDSNVLEVETTDPSAPAVDVGAMQRQWAAQTCLDEINASLNRHNCSLEFQQAFVNGVPQVSQFKVAPK